MMVNFKLVVLVLAICGLRYRMAKAEELSIDSVKGKVYTLDSVREALVRQEDTIIFGLIERAKFPINSPTYDENCKEIPQGFSGSLVDFVVKNTEAVQAKVTSYCYLICSYACLFHILACLGLSNFVSLLLCSELCPCCVLFANLYLASS